MEVTAAGVALGAVESNFESDTYRYEFDRDTTPASLAAVAALSTVMDVDPTELEPLYATVDTEALDDLIRVRGATTGDVHVSWTYGEYAVTVHSYGVVAVAPSGPARTDDGTGARSEGRTNDRIEGGFRR